MSLIRATFILTTWELRYSASIEGIPEPESIRIQVVQVLEEKLQTAVEAFQTTGDATNLYGLITQTRLFTLLERSQVLDSYFRNTEDINYLNGYIACLDLLRHYIETPELLEMSVDALILRSNRLKTSNGLDRATELCELLKGKVPESKRWSLVTNLLECELEAAEHGPMESLDEGLRRLKDTIKVIPPDSPDRVDILHDLTRGMTLQILSIKPSEPWDDDKFDEAVAIAEQLLHASEAHPEGDMKLALAQECLSTLFYHRSCRNNKASDRHKFLCYERRKRPNGSHWNNISPAFGFRQRVTFAGKLSESDDPEDLVEAVSILSDLKNAIPSGDTQCTENFLLKLVSVGESIDSQPGGKFFDSITEAQRRLQDLVSQLDIKSLGAVSEDIMQHVNIYLHQHGLGPSNAIAQCSTEEGSDRETCRSQLAHDMIFQAVSQNDMNLMREGALLLEQVSVSASHDDPLAQAFLGAAYGYLSIGNRDSNHLNRALHHAGLSIRAAKSPLARLDGVSFWYGIAGAARILSNHPPPRRDWGFALDVAIDSITQLAGLEATVAHEILRGRPSWLPCIVSTLIADGEFPKALESLERIRGFVWNQLSSLRFLMTFDHAIPPLSIVSSSCPKGWRLLAGGYSLWRKGYRGQMGRKSQTRTRRPLISEWLKSTKSLSVLFERQFQGSSTSFDHHA